jgi:hypothetical protein
LARVRQFLFRRWHVADRLQQPPIVVPVDPLERRALDRVGLPLRPASVNHFRAVLRCSACQTRFTAPLPRDVPPEKYDASADVAIAMAKYSAGLRFYRLARVQEAFGVPLGGVPLAVESREMA